MKTWGGRRDRAGRKKVVGRRRVAHARRAEFRELSPLHVTVKVVKGLRSLRTRKMAAALQRAFVAGCERGDFRVVQFSVMTNHLHLIVEAETRTALSRGMQGLLVRMARNLNSALLRKGKVFADRFHSRVLGSTVDVKNTLLYVLNNARRHGIAFHGAIDPYSSGAWFTGWCEDFDAPRRSERPVALARSWQLVSGWQMHGLIDPRRTPPAGLN